MRGIIMLDGPDGSGKSTLAEELASQVESVGGSAKICHSVPKEASDCWSVHSQELLDHCLSAFSGEGGVIILDRFFATEAIYGDVYRGMSAYPATARSLDRLLYRFRAIRVLCAPPSQYVEETHRRLCSERHEEFLTSMDVVAQRYLDLWAGAEACEVGQFKQQYMHTEYTQQLCLLGGVRDRRGWYRYDVSVEGNQVDRVASALLEQLQTELATAAPLDLDLGRHFTGNSAAEALLVGDRLGGPNDLSVPFYANDGSSLYLMQTLQELATDESKLCIANVNDPGGVATVRWLAAGKRVIALGREAEKTLAAHGIPYDTTVRHPQHARRFTSRDDSYAAELRQAFDGLAGVTKV